MIDFLEAFFGVTALRQRQRTSFDERLDVQLGFAAPVFLKRAVSAVFVINQKQIENFVGVDGRIVMIKKTFFDNYRHKNRAARPNLIKTRV